METQLPFKQVDGGTTVGSNYPPLAVIAEPHSFNSQDDITTHSSNEDPVSTTIADHDRWSYCPWPQVDWTDFDWPASLNPLSYQSVDLNLSAEPRSQGGRNRKRSRKQNIPNGYPCQEPGCDKSFDTQGELNKHFQRAHIPEVDRSLGCKQCSRRFHYPKDLLRHQQNIHAKLGNKAEEGNQLTPLAETPAPVALRHRGASAADGSRGDDITAAGTGTFRSFHHSSSEDGFACMTSDFRNFMRLGASLTITIKARVPDGPTSQLEVVERVVECR